MKGHFRIQADWAPRGWRTIIEYILLRELVKGFSKGIEVVGSMMPHYLLQREQVLLPFLQTSFAYVEDVQIRMTAAEACAVANDCYLCGVALQC